MATALSESLPAAEYRASSVNKWLVAVAAMLATTVEVLDTTIANVALYHIRGSLSAGVDEAAWVLTSYIVANAIVIPLTGWCGNYFGRKRFFNFCILFFAGSSLMAGASPNLQALIFFRLLQGAAGGALMPMSQAILMETFRPEEQAVAMSVWGIGMMLAPVAGPILGGWIVDNYSWRWIFYINVPVGLLASWMVTLFVHDPAYIKRHIKRIDWWGLSYLGLGVGSLQVLLDKGERLDWFTSHLINALAVAALIGIVLFVIRELRTKEPIVDLGVLRNRSFAVGTLFTTLVMFGLYGTYVLTPLYCQSVAGYTPLLAGLVLGIQSFGTFLSIVLAGRLFNRVDPRILVALGSISAGIGAWDMTSFSTQTTFWQIAGPGILRGLGSGLVFIPLTTLSLSAVSKEEMGNASGLFNMVRTIGGSVGIAILVAMLSSRAQVHQSYLSYRIDPFRLGIWQRLYPAASGAIMNFTRHGSMPFLGMVYQEVQRQALLMAFVDDFRLIAYIFFALTPMVFLMRRPQLAGVAASAH
jgi:MFS transporter, DHA2 family, multidrug resistance protein